MTIGRSTVADVIIDDDSVSRRHAALHVGAQLRVEDLGSTNGTRVRGKSIKARKPVEIEPGDRIEIGSATLMVEVEANGSAAVRQQGADLTEIVVVPGGALDRLEPQIRAAAVCDLNLLVEGETGAGKEIVARMVHARSARASKPFFPVHCGALPQSLVESELFGHERGAFTGATEASPGLLDSAERGTLFLDEIAELPARTQLVLLRVLDDRRVLSVGGRRWRSVDVRFIAATSRNMRDEVESDRFRKDLFHRLSAMQITVPPLRERRTEICELALGFHGQICRRLGYEPQPVFAPEALDFLISYPWPGNVRELRHAIERALVRCGAAPTITREHLVLGTTTLSTSPPATLDATESVPTGRHGLRGAVMEAERARIVEALDRARGNQTEAAKLLDVSRSTLLRRLAAYGLAQADDPEDR